MVAVDEHPTVRLHLVDEAVGHQLAGLLHRGAVPPGRQPGRLAGEQHGREGLADGVEDLVEQALTRDVAVGQHADVAQGLGDDRAARPPQQGPVEVEERSGITGHGSRSGHAAGNRRPGVRRPPRPASRRHPARQTAEGRGGSRVHQAEGPIGGDRPFSLGGRAAGGSLVLVLEGPIWRKSARPRRCTHHVQLSRAICPTVPSDSDVSFPAMDLRQLAALIAVADHRSFSAAARALHTVQSNVSAHVARLERELGVTPRRPVHRRAHRRGALPWPRARRIDAEFEAPRRRRRLVARRGRRLRAPRRHRHHRHGGSCRRCCAAVAARTPRSTSSWSTPPPPPWCPSWPAASSTWRWSTCPSTTPT